MMRFGLSVSVTAVVAVFGLPATAYAQSAATPAEPSLGGLQDIIVTAQKRSQKLNDVPISVNVVSGADLATRGVANVSDLTKVVPGLSAAQSQFGPPVFTLRGVGFYDSSLGAKPSVSVYVDEVAMPFSIMTRGVGLDLERIEVLKGPQGTLFGQNATGGAINYIAAKPTKTFKAGLDLGYTNFDQITAGGYVSGPLSSTLSARIALQTEQGGAYQKSITRPGDRLGDRNFTSGRLLLSWEPSSSARFVLGANGFIDKSDTTAAQYFFSTPLTPSGVKAAYTAAAFATRDNQSADWTPGRTQADDWFYQLSLRGEVDLSDSLQLISVTSYSKYKPDFVVDPDGLALNVYSQRTIGKITSFNQEVRVAGDLGDRLKFILGGNYAKERSFQRDHGTNPDASSTTQFLAVGLGPEFNDYVQLAKQNIESYAVFGNLDYEIGDKIVLHGGARYTKTDIDFSGCSADSGANTLGLALQNLYNFVLRPAVGLSGNVTIPPGTCVTLRTDPTKPTFFTPGIVENSLNEDNISWRVGIDYKPVRDVLIYVSASKGYKSGSFPALAATDSNQYSPVSQESVLAYEFGLKATVLDRRAQINAALFHYGYDDKQVRGRVITSPDIFGPIEALLNVPKVTIQGAELQLDLAPTDGLRVSIGATYIYSKIKGDFNSFDSFGASRNFKGEPLPLTPKYQISIDGQYDWGIANNVGAFLGSNLEFRSDTNGALGENQMFKIRDYALVDLRGGLKFSDGRYQISGFVRNIFDTYYTNNSQRISDTVVAFAGRPRTYGMNFQVRY